MNKPFVYRLINQRNCRIQKFGALRFVRIGHRDPKLFDLRAKLAAVASVDLVSLGVLPDALYG